MTMSTSHVYSYLGLAGLNLKQPFTNLVVTKSSLIFLSTDYKNSAERDEFIVPYEAPVSNNLVRNRSVVFLVIFVTSIFSFSQKLPHFFFFYQMRIVLM